MTTPDTPGAPPSAGTAPQSEVREASRRALSATNGLKADLTPLQTAEQLRLWIVEGNDYSRRKKMGFKRAASAVRVSALGMSAAATVILGLQNLGFWTGLGFALVALSTATGGVEAFFNWRSRWIFAEEAQYSLYRLQDDLDFLVAQKNPLEFADLEPLYARYAEIWDRFALQWLEERRRGSTGH